MAEINKIVDFIEYGEGLKRELRNSWLSNNRKESVAEHSWRMSLMAILIYPHTNLNLDMQKVFSMIAIHDITEIDAGDVPTVLHMTDEKIKQKKIIDENIAIDNVRNKLNSKTGDYIYELWHDFENQSSDEARFVKILDKFEAIIQKYQASFESYQNLDDSQKEGAPGYFKMVEELCKIDSGLSNILNNLVLRKDKVKKDRRLKLNTQ